MKKKTLIAASWGVGILLVVRLAFAQAASVPECQFTAPPTPEQMAACQQAQAAAAAAQQPQQPAQPPSADTPPTGVPAFAPPSGIPTEIPSAPPAGIPTGPTPEQMAQINAAKLKGMQSGLRGMQSGYAKLAAQVAKIEKTGFPVPSDIKNKMAEIVKIIDTIKNAKVAEDVENVDMDRFSDLMDELGTAVADLRQQAEMMKGLKLAAKNMKIGIRMFDAQIAKLTKQNVAVPADIGEILGQVKAIIAAIEGNKSWDELQALGIENIDELFDKLDDGRERIVVLGRWPKTLQQVDRQLASMDKTVVRLKAVAEKLLGSGIDVSGYQAEYAAGVAALRAVRNDADAKVRAGAGMEAFELLEEGYFGKLESVIESQRIVETMANMGRFVSEYGKTKLVIQKQIAALAKKQVPTAEVDALFAQFKAKGDAIVAMLKVKPVDPDAVLAAVEEFEGLRVTLVEKANDLAGGAAMPWDTGTVPVKELKIPKAMDDFLIKNKEKDLNEGPDVPSEPPAPQLPAAPGTGLLIEAENENASSILPPAQRPAVNTEEIRPSWRPPYSGTGDWYLAAKGEWLSYTFEIAEAGTYAVWIRDYVDKFQPKGVRRVVVSFDGVPYGTFAEVDKPSTGAKGDFGWHKVGAGIVLSSGQHVMKVAKEATTSGAAILDAYYLTIGAEVPTEK